MRSNDCYIKTLVLFMRVRVDTKSVYQYCHVGPPVRPASFISVAPSGQSSVTTDTGEFHETQLQK
jgi:hypothetical protein